MYNFLITSTPESFIPVMTSSEKRTKPEFVKEIIPFELRNYFVNIGVPLADIEIRGCKGASWVETSDDPLEYGSESIFVVYAIDVIAQISEEVRSQVVYHLESNGYFYPTGRITAKYCWFFSTRCGKLERV